MNHALIPFPLAITVGDESLTISAGSAISVSTALLAPLAERFVGDVANDSGLRLGVVDTPESDALIRFELVSSDVELAALTATGGVRADAGENDDERHGVEVTASGIRVWALTPEGLFRGATTLRQLIADGRRDADRVVLDTVRILDTPRFAWRGLSLDVARTFHGPDQVRRVIDMLALHKLNALHLHLTDDQGWRVPISGWPRLTELSAAPGADGRAGGSYTVDDIRSLVEYGRDRYVTIVPEVDMPGHSAAVFAAYPELAPETWDAALAAEAGALAMVGTLDPHRDITWTFVREVLTEVAALFPNSSYLHIGGDEAFGMADDDHALFVSRAAAIVHDLGRRAAGWQEAARGILSSDDLVQYWIEPEIVDMLSSEAAIAMIPEGLRDLLVETFEKAKDDVVAARSQGARVTVSPTSTLYFDRPYGEPSTDESQEQQRTRVGLQLYPPVTLREAYEADPIAAVAGLDTLDGVAGIEGAVWCETVTGSDDLEFLLLPRLSGLGEIAWSPRTAIGWDDYRARLARLAAVWDARGWGWFRSSLVDWHSSDVTSAA